MKTKLVAVIALIFCAFMAEASKVEGNGNIITKEIPGIQIYAWTKRFLENYDRRESIPTPLDQIQ